MSGFEAVFGIVTGGAGLISLGLQLGDCAQRLNKIYHSIKDAPKSLHQLSFDLETMAMCLQMLEQRRQLGRPSQNPAAGILARCIAACQQATDDTQRLVDKMTRRLQDHSKLRGKAYFLFKEQDIQQLLSDLERAKNSIQLAYMMYQAEEQRQNAEKQQILLMLQGNLLKGLESRIDTTSIVTANQTTLTWPRPGIAPTMVLDTDHGHSSKLKSRMHSLRGDYISNKYSSL